MALLRQYNAGTLSVSIYDNRLVMGETAAADGAKVINALLKEKETLNVLFAAAPSQNELLEALRADKSIDWSRINAFHMDEYVAIHPSAPQGFAQFLRTRLFGQLPFKSVNYIDCSAEGETEAKRYEKLLGKHPLDVCFMGVGENGHIAFNDPPVADFEDPALVKVVELEDRCRQQQVNDGCFAQLSDVPEYAITLTVPTLISAKEIFCVVPASAKADAVKEMLGGDVSTNCPASILTTHPSARLYLDPNSGKYVL